MEKSTAGDGFLRPLRSALLCALLVVIDAGDPRSQSWAAVCNSTSSSTTASTFRVESYIDVTELKEAVSCDGGHVEAVWSGLVILYNETILIGHGTSLSITGEDQQAGFRGVGTRMFHISEGGSLTLTQLKLSGGTAEKGGAIYSYGANLTLDSCVFDGNSAYAGSGGAVWAQGGEVKILGGVFSNNSATDFGGALFANITDLTIQDGTGFEDNKAVQGGALYGTGLLSCSLHNATFVSNNASHEEDFDTDSDDDAFSGGAAAFVDSEVVISDCLFYNNSAQLSGGAVFGGTDTVLTVDSCTLRNNTALKHGGAIAASSATIGGGTELAHNFADEDGGGEMEGFNAKGDH